MKTTFRCKNLIALNMQHELRCRLEVIKTVTRRDVWTFLWLTGMPARSSCHLSESLVLLLRVHCLIHSAFVVDMLTKMCVMITHGSHVVWFVNPSRWRQRVFQKRGFLVTQYTFWQYSQLLPWQPHTSRDACRRRRNSELRNALVRSFANLVTCLSVGLRLLKVLPLNSFCRL
jgi:hypothetical protein